MEEIAVMEGFSEKSLLSLGDYYINAFNYVSDVGLTNIVAGHHSAEALSVEDFEKIHGAEELCERV